MAKFIEINQFRLTWKRFQDDYIRDFEIKPIIVNVDMILTIIPNGDSCIITLPGETENVHAAHSAQWVMGLINGQQ